MPFFKAKVVSSFTIHGAGKEYDFHSKQSKAKPIESIEVLTNKALMYEKFTFIQGDTQIRTGG